MVREVKLNEVDRLLDDAGFAYPVSRADVREELGDVLLRYADGEERLTAVLDRVNTDRFQSQADVQSEIFSQLPTEAVGEPGQSEGEG